MSKELTEQWRNGTLVGGIYYCKTKSYGEKKLWFHHRAYGGMYVQTYGTEEMFPEEDIIDILAPVPTYDQFVDLTEKVEQLEQDNKCLRSGINTYESQLSCISEQLKEANEVIHLYFKNTQSVAYKSLGMNDGYYKNAFIHATAKEYLEKWGLK